MFHLAWSKAAVCRVSLPAQPLTYTTSFSQALAVSHSSCGRAWTISVSNNHHGLDTSTPHSVPRGHTTSKLVCSDLWKVTRKCAHSSRSQPRSLGNGTFHLLTPLLSAYSYRGRSSVLPKPQSIDWVGALAGDGLLLSPGVLGVSEGLLMSPA